MSRKGSQSPTISGRRYGQLLTLTSHLLAYEEAFQFDQLRKIMEEGRGFEGFKEAPIDFPPTYVPFALLPTAPTPLTSYRPRPRALQLQVRPVQAHQAVKHKDGAAAKEQVALRGPGGRRCRGGRRRGP